MNDLLNCKIGDKLITSKHGYKMLHTITGETKTQWICNKYRFRKDSGKLVGGDSWSFWAQKATPEAIEEMRIESEIKHAQRLIEQVVVNESNLDLCKTFLNSIK